MKAIDKTRTTNTFCIVGVAVTDMVALAAHFGSSLVAVAHDAKDARGVYTVRTSNRATGIYDIQCTVIGNEVFVNEKQTVVDFSALDRLKAAA